tara:strand:- start:816 stop:1001 length:186 start_codon:yes stop_codon:yes gene_type:complete
MPETKSQKQSVMSMSNLQGLIESLRKDKLQKSLGTLRKLENEPLKQQMDDDVAMAKLQGDI